MKDQVDLFIAFIGSLIFFDIVVAQFFESSQPVGLYVDPLTYNIIDFIVEISVNLFTQSLVVGFVTVGTFYDA